MKGEEKRTPTLEESMQRLEAIVSELEAGDQPLERALERFEEGLEIGKRCREILDHAEERVRRLVDVDEAGRTLTDEVEE